MGSALNSTCQYFSKFFITVSKHVSKYLLIGTFLSLSIMSVHCQCMVSKCQSLSVINGNVSTYLTSSDMALDLQLICSSDSGFLYCQLFPLF